MSHVDKWERNMPHKGKTGAKILRQSMLGLSMEGMEEQVGQCSKSRVGEVEYEKRGLERSPWVVT